METPLIVPFAKRPCRWRAATPLKPSAAQESSSVDPPWPVAPGQPDAAPPSPRLPHRVKATRAEQGRSEASPGAGFSLPPRRQAGGSSRTCSSSLVPRLAALPCASSANEGERGRFPSSLWVWGVERGRKAAEKRGVPGSPRPPAGPLLFPEPADVSIAL